MFDRQYKADSLSMVINEEMAKQLGEDDPLSARIIMDDSITYSVIGVIKNYNFQDISRKVQPLTLFMNREWDLYYAYVKIAPTNVAQSFDEIKSAWNKVEPQAEFLGSFLDVVSHQLRLSHGILDFSRNIFSRTREHAK